MTAPTIDRIWAIDTEGNGKNPSEIVEISVVEIFRMRFTGFSRTWRVRPPSGISPFASRIHGIYDKDTENSPLIQDVLPGILNIIGDEPIVGHGVRVEVNAITGIAPAWRPIAAYDTFRLAKKMLPSMEKYALNPLGVALGLDTAAAAMTHGSPHGSFYDAALSGMLMVHMIGHLSLIEKNKILKSVNVIPSDPKRACADHEYPTI
jgi:DNA polymerase III epsilon subunit-like protein